MEQRTKLLENGVKVEISAKINYKINCEEFYKYIKKPEKTKLLKSNKEYIFKSKSKHKSVSQF